MKDGVDMNSYFAKQPILDLKGETYGYELLYRNAPTVASYDGYDGDKSTAGIINSVFFGENKDYILDIKRAFLNFTENLLLEKTALLLPKDQIAVEILETVSVSDEVLACCKELVEKGYVVALDDYVYSPETAQLLDYCQIVKIDFRNSKKEIEDTAEQCRRLGKILLAEKIETMEEAEYAKSLGCTLMQGYFFAQPLIMMGRSYNPMAVTFSKLIAALQNKDMEIDELADIISKDPFMAAKLLRLVNAVRRGMSEHISSIRQAILMLGLNKLKDWIYLVGLQSLSQDGPDEKVKVALFRAMFCKEISFIISDDATFGEEMYLMGLLSVVVNTKDKETMSAMKLSNNIIDGLSGKNGIYGDTFNFVLNFEQANWMGVDSYAAKYKLDGKMILKQYIECMNRVEIMFDSAAK